MNKTSLAILIGGVFVMLLMAAAAVSFLAMPVLTKWMHQPRGVVLIYEIDRRSVPDVKKVDMAELLRKLDSRLNSGSRVARVREIEDHRIEVALYSISANAADNVDRLLQRPGTLEFRILANRRDNKKLIERALADPSRVKLLDSAGNLEGWWVPVKAEEASAISQYRDIALRTVPAKEGKPATTEVLLVPDPYDVTGADLSMAYTDVDQQGRPCVRLAFTSDGGRRFAELTGEHLPDEVNPKEINYKLGIVLDGTVCSTPWILAEISQYAEITGSFTDQDVRELAAILNAGSLPAKIRLVKKVEESTPP